MEKYSFFNSVGGDRRYNASDWAEYFARLVGNGVFGSPANCLKTSPGEHIQALLSPGAAWINGYHYANTATLALPLPTPDGVLHRIDRIVIRWSFSERSITAKVKSGAPASIPHAPALQRDVSVWELGIADVYVAAGATAILAANITDLRGDPALCGTVSSIVSEAHAHDAATQSKAGFLSAADKKALDGVIAKVTQDVSATASPTFKVITAEKVIGAVYA
jgi:hypothetical protein